MKIKAIVIEASGQARLLELDKNDHLKPLQEAVGGYIERVTVGDLDFWVNEEGKLDGLPVNRIATKLLYRMNPAWRGHDVLCGPVVLMGTDDASGHGTTVPENFIQEFGVSDVAV